jgi:predicted nucleic acid-binding protein
LAVSLNADLLLMDDRKGVNAAQKKGLLVTGTLAFLIWRRNAAWRTSRKRWNSYGTQTSEFPKLYWMPS